MPRPGHVWAAMRIGLDGIVLRNPVAGSHRYFEQLLAGLDQPGAENEYVVFTNLRALRAGTRAQQHNFSFRNVNPRRWIILIIIVLGLLIVGAVSAPPDSTTRTLAPVFDNSPATTEPEAPAPTTM